jgi:hypothetical protein
MQYLLPSTEKKLLLERASMLRCMYSVCLVSFQHRKFEALKVGGG